MRMRRHTWAFATIGAVLLGVVPAGATPTTSVDGAAVAASALEHFAPVDARAKLLQQQLGTGSLGRAVAAAHAGDGAAAPAHAPLPQALLNSKVAHRYGEAAGQAVADIAAVVRESTEAIGFLRPADLAAALRAQEAKASRNAGTTAQPASARPAVTRALAAIPAASQQIADVLDEHVPTLRTAATRTAATTERVAGCDVVNQLPYLCVGSEANNVHTANAAVLIDFGGADVYENTAGGAPFPDPGSGRLHPVSVNVDLAGNDLYTPKPFTQHFSEDPFLAYDELILGMGGGFLGLGVLVDEAGDDRYLARETSDPARCGGEACTPTRAVKFAVQGAGFMGEGILLDRAGKDVYTVEASGDGDVRSRMIVAQGAARDSAALGPPSPHVLAGGGAGVLMDLDQAQGAEPKKLHTDAFSVDAGAVASTPEAPTLQLVVAQGAGSTLNGALYSAGGGDSFAVRANAAAAADSAGVDSPNSNLAIVAQGANDGAGSGFLLTDVEEETAGHSQYLVKATAARAATVKVDAQGSATYTTSGLYDGFGSDSYTIDVRREHVGAVRPSAECMSAPPCKVRRDLNFDFLTRVTGQGIGFQTGLGMLRDASGDDSYRMAVSVNAVVDLLAGGSSADDVALDVVGYRPPIVYAQGAGVGNNSHGGLIDGDGSDRYVVDVGSSLEARTSSTQGARGVTAFTPPPSSGSLAQGAGSSGQSGGGLLYDQEDQVTRTRQDNVFDVSFEKTTSTAPDPGGAYTVGYSLPRTQGDGGFFVVDTPGATVRSSPSGPVCGLSDPGYRGFGRWFPCRTLEDDPEHQYQSNGRPDRGGGWVGVMPWDAANAPRGQTPQLTLTNDTATAAHIDIGRWGTSSPWNVRDGLGRLPAGARLVTPAGDPVPGVNLRFGLQLGIACTGDRCDGPFLPHEILWRADGVTDSDGVARADLPLLVWDCHAAFATGSNFLVGTAATPAYRLIVSFDGAPGLHPRHLVVPLETTSDHVDDC